MSWVLTCTGEEHALQGLLHTPTLTEIAHSLAQINRFTGHASRPYSVAEHSLLVEDIASTYTSCPTTRLAALLHDAHECITGDVASPIKAVLGAAWAAFEHTHQANLRESYALESADWALIKHCDLVALATERRCLMPYTPGTSTPWPILDTAGADVAPYEGINLQTPGRSLTHWQDWAKSYKARARELMRRHEQAFFETEADTA